MMISKACFCLALTAAAPLVTASAWADSEGFNLRQSNGENRRISLLTVHPDSTHSPLVRRRLANQISTISAPTSYSIATSKLPTIRDQGSRSTCVYFATVGLLETSLIAKSASNRNLNLSEECLANVRNWMFDQGAAYTGDDQPKERPDPNGDFPASVTKTITEIGVPAEGSFGSMAKCSYDGTVTYGGRISAADYRAIFEQGSSPAYGKGALFNLDSAPTHTAIKALLAQNIPVEVAIYVYPEFAEGSDWRFNAQKDTEFNVAGGHAIILTGYRTVQGKMIYTFKNSWGSNWGVAGYGTIDEGLLNYTWSMDADFDKIVSIK